MVKYIVCLLTVFILSPINFIYAKSAMDYYKQAKEQVNPQEQIRLTTLSIGLSPKMVGAYHLRGDAYKNVGRFQEAISDYTITINLRPKDPFRYYARAITYEQIGEYSLAVSDLTKAISLKPEYSDFYLHRARDYGHLLKYDAAIKDYKKYLQKGSLTASLALEIASIDVEGYHYQEANSLLDQAEKFGEDGKEYHYLKGRVYAGQNKWDEAISCYSKALNRDKDYAIAYRYRANAFNEIENYEDSVEDYTSLIALQPEAIFYNRRGLIQEKLEKYAQAEQDYTSAIALNPKWAIPFNNRGFVRLRLKNYTSAKSDLDTALSLDGTTPTAYVNLAGWYWLTKKDKKNTYKNIDRAIQLNLKDVDSLYDESKKGWLFKGINNTSTFKALLYK